MMKLSYRDQRHKEAFTTFLEQADQKEEQIFKLSEEVLKRPHEKMILVAKSLLQKRYISGEPSIDEKWIDEAMYLIHKQ